MIIGDPREYFLAELVNINLSETSKLFIILNPEQIKYSSIRFVWDLLKSNID